MARFFISSRQLGGFHAVELSEGLLIEHHGRLAGVLRERCGEAAAALFAEPLMSRGNGATGTRVDWYTDLEGPARPLSELGEDDAGAVAMKLERLLALIKPLQFDREVGLLVALALNVASPQSILSIGGEPVIVDWGLLPKTLAEDPASRRRHFAAVFGAAADGLSPPPRTQAEWSAAFASSSSPAGQAGGPRATAPQAGLSAPAAAQGVVVRSSLRAALIGTGVAAALLALTFVPGVLRFPSEAALASPEAVRIQQGVLDQVLARGRQLEAAMTEDCGAPATRARWQALLPPPIESIRIPASPGSGSGPAPGPGAVAVAPGGPGAAATATPGAASPGAASQGAQAPGAPAASPRQETSLVALIEQGVVLVLVGGTSGSGFFVSGDLIVTNRHVIEGRGDNQIYVVNKKVGILRAEFVAAAGEGAYEDFAVLRVPTQAGVTPLQITSSNAPLQQVVAAGFPGFTLQTDAVFRRLISGDAAAAAEIVPVMTTGTINHLQRQQQPAVTLVVHGADIAPGNSGGPLLDLCGRVVGVNTFGRPNQRVLATTKYALGSDGLGEFLARRSLPAQQAEGTCTPTVTAAAPAPAPSAAPTAAPPAAAPAAAPAPAPAPAAAAGQPTQR